MKQVFLLAGISVLLNCNTSKKSGFGNIPSGDPCRIILEDLQRRLYKIDRNFYGLKLYAPTYKERIDEFLQMGKKINRESNMVHKKCLSELTYKDIVSHFGKPNTVNNRADGKSRFSVAYRLNFGGKCPCENCVASEKYYECNILDFNFDSTGRVNAVRLSNLYHSLK